MSEDQGIRYQIVEDNENETEFKPIKNMFVPTFKIPENIQNEITKNTLESQVKETDFVGQIRKFVAERNPGLVILTPCYGGTAFVSYMESLIQTFSLCKEIGLRLKIIFCRNDSLVSRARNNLIAKAMNDPGTTHMLFIDADITWEPLDVIKLLLADKGLVGGIYPIKKYNWENITANPNFIQNIIEKKQTSQVKDMFSDIDYIKTNMVRYNVNYESQVLHVSNNLAKVRHLATGFMMIKREVIETMMRGYPTTKYTDDVGFLSGTENNYAYALFDCGVEDDHYYSEDWMFCHRWTKMGGGVYIDITINLDHTGVETFKGSYISSIM